MSDAVLGTKDTTANNGCSLLSSCLQFNKREKRVNRPFQYRNKDVCINDKYEISREYKGDSMKEVSAELGMKDRVGVSKSRQRLP